MQLPAKDIERTKLHASIRDLKGDPRFDRVVDWFRSELAKRDAENRLKGFENSETAAQTMADFINIVTACQAPAIDRDDNKEPGAESIMSAEPRI